MKGSGSFKQNRIEYGKILTKAKVQGSSTKEWLVMCMFVCQQMFNIYKKNVVNLLEMQNM